MKIGDMGRAAVRMLPNRPVTIVIWFAALYAFGAIVALVVLFSFGIIIEDLDSFIRGCITFISIAILLVLAFEVFAFAEHGDAKMTEILLRGADAYSSRSSTRGAPWGGDLVKNTPFKGPWKTALKALAFIVAPILGGVILLGCSYLTIMASLNNGDDETALAKAIVSGAMIGAYAMAGLVWRDIGYRPKIMVSWLFPRMSKISLIANAEELADSDWLIDRSRGLANDHRLMEWVVRVGMGNGPNWKRPGDSLTTIEHMIVGQDEVGFELLIQHPRFDPNAMNATSGDTILNVAVRHENLHAIAHILSHPLVDLNARDFEGDTVLYEALLRKNPVIVKMLLEKGADPLIEIDRFGDHFEITRTLVKMYPGNDSCRQLAELMFEHAMTMDESDLPNEMLNRIAQLLQVCPISVELIQSFHRSASLGDRISDDSVEVDKKTA